MAEGPTQFTRCVKSNWPPGAAGGNGSQLVVLPLPPLSCMLLQFSVPMLQQLDSGDSNSGTMAAMEATVVLVELETAAEARGRCGCACRRVEISPSPVKSSQISLLSRV